MERERDLLDDLTELEARTNPNAVAEWEAMRKVVEASMRRQERGLTQADIAAQVGIPESRVAEIESAPWAASLDLIAAYLRAIEPVAAGQPSRLRA